MRWPQHSPAKFFRPEVPRGIFSTRGRDDVIPNLKTEAARRQLGTALHSTLKTKIRSPFIVWPVAGAS